MPDQFNPKIVCMSSAEKRLVVHLIPPLLLASLARNESLARRAGQRGRGDLPIRFRGVPAVVVAPWCRAHGRASGEFGTTLPPEVGVKVSITAAKQQQILGSDLSRGFSEHCRPSTYRAPNLDHQISNDVREATAPRVGALQSSGPRAGMADDGDERWQQRRGVRARR